MSYQATEQNILLIYGIIVLLKINFPVALVIHFPPISISLTINWESQLHKCSSGEPMPKKPLNQKNQSKITKSTKTCLKPVTLDNSVMPALEPICSLMQSLCPSSSHLVPSSCPGRLGQAFTSPRGLWQVPPHPSQAQTPSRSNSSSTEANMAWQASFGTVPAQLTASHLCLPPFIKPHKSREQWGVCPHRRHTG